MGIWEDYQKRTLPGCGYQIFADSGISPAVFQDESVSLIFNDLSGCHSKDPLLNSRLIITSVETDQRGVVTNSGSAVLEAR